MGADDVQVLLLVLQGLKDDLRAINDKQGILIDRVNLDIIPKLIAHDVDIQDINISIGKTNVALKGCIEDTTAKINAITTLTGDAVNQAAQSKKFWDRAKALWGKLHISLKWLTFVIPPVITYVTGWLIAHGHTTVAAAVQYVVTYVATVVPTATITLVP